MDRGIVWAGMGCENVREVNSANVYCILICQ